MVRRSEWAVVVREEVRTVIKVKDGNTSPSSSRSKIYFVRILVRNSFVD